MMRWLNRVQPLAGIVPAYLVLHALFVGWLLYMESILGQPFDAEAKRKFLMVSFPGLAAFAVWRVVGFHPFRRPGLRDWLEATPWTSRQQLPFGPVHWTVQDLVFVGADLWLNWLIAGPVVWPSFLFFPVVYLLSLATVFFLTKAWKYGYACLFGVGLIVLLRVVPVASALAVLASYGIALLGLRSSLAGFPWGRGWLSELPEAFKPRLNPETSTSPGWPLTQIAPRLAASEFRIPFIQALLASLLAGWICFVLLSFEPNLPARSETSKWFCAMVWFLAPIIRLAIYVANYANPVSLRARLATGLWLFPGYDHVYVTPGLALCAGLGAFGLLNGLPAGGVVLASPFVVAMVLFLCLAMGPELRNWQLTGKHTLRKMGTTAADIKVG